MFASLLLFSKRYCTNRIVVTVLLFGVLFISYFIGEKISIILLSFDFENSLPSHNISIESYEIKKQ